MQRKAPDYNLLPIAQDYFSCIFSDIPDMKALLLDNQTSGIISIIYTQSKLYKNDIYLVQRIDQKTQKLGHLKGVYFIRPTRDNIELLKKELKQPRFKEYHLLFTNDISESLINELAENDPSDKIKSLQEIYLDYYATGRNIFSLNIPSTIALARRKEAWAQSEHKLVSRMAEGIISVVMSLRLMPQVRYISESECCGQIAKLVSKKMERQLMEKQSDYKLDQKAILIITERKEDVVTPLLTPWTYEAMLHEFIGIFNNKVDIVNKQKAFMIKSEDEKKLTIKEKEERQFVLSELTDEFFRKNVYSGFGQLAGNIKSFINQVSVKRNKTVKLESLEDMHSALDKIPELNALSATLQKHVTLSCKISEQIQKGVLFQVSKTEQDLVCQDNRKENIDNIWKIIRNPKIQYFLKMKLVLLFSIRYPNDKEIKEFLAFLQTAHDDKTLVSLINLIGQYQIGRKTDLFHMKNFKKKAFSYFDRILKDVPNVYTQHKPYIFENVLPQFVQDRVKQTEYRTAFKGKESNLNRNKPIIILFYVGGVTYTEAKQAEEFAEATVIVGGSFIHNSKTFIGQVLQLQQDANEL